MFVATSLGTSGAGTGAAALAALEVFNTGWGQLAEGLDKVTGGRIQLPTIEGTAADVITGTLTDLWESGKAVEQHGRSAWNDIEHILTHPWGAYDVARKYLR